ncbi:TPA: P-type conjugative transfer protein TrbL [Pseudomonas aeruginosa]|nr:P-type conjugative transfer protein TrbL [Pseudomonas aeruginosa]HBP5172993.1 P-type conjugative transfer protein TrbL [Pseudomonas aeruginosa]
MNRKTIPLCFAALALLLLTGTAMAQGADLTQSNTAMNGLLREIHEASNAWTGRLQGYATHLLVGLAVIQLVLQFMPLVFKQAEIGETVGEMVRTILVVGFFFALIEHGTEWVGAVVNSFRQAGASAAGLPTEKLMPGDMFALAVEFSEKIMNSGMSILSPITSGVIALGAIIVLLCFAFIAALIFVTLVEAYVVINGSVLLFGFGSLRLTREYAIAPLRYGVAVGVKLFVLTLLVGLIMTAAAGWSAKYSNDQASLLTLVGLSLVCAYLTRTIPELMGGMISGVSMGGGHAIGGMAAAGAAGAAAAIATLATAGAAAPAAAGAIGAAGTGGAAGAAGGVAGGAAGGGGLASLINSSFAGQAGAASAGSTAGGSMASAASTGSNAAKAAAPRVGGGEAASGPAPKPTGAASSGVKQPATAAGQAQHGGDDKSQAQAQPAPAPSPDSGRSKASTFASGAVRMAGVLSAMSVPGMESAAGLSLNAPNTPAAGSAGEAPTENAGGPNEPENVIRPARAASSEPDGSTAETKAAPSPTTDASKPASSLSALRIPGMASYPNPQGA